MNPLKQCHSCGENKPLVEFYRWKYSKDGHRTQCKVCSSVDIKEYRKKYPHRIRNTVNLYRKRFPMRTKSIGTKALESLYLEHPYCEYCGIALSPREAGVDHIVPMSRGGTNSLDNLAICCFDCNSLKGTKTREEFRLFIPVYISRFKGNTEPSLVRERCDGQACNNSHKRPEALA